MVNNGLLWVILDKSMVDWLMTLANRLVKNGDEMVVPTHQRGVDWL